MKGFVITLDAVIALTFTLFALVIISSQSYKPTAPGDIYLKQLTLDTLTVLEKTGGINQAIAGNSSAIQSVIEATPELNCINISITNEQTTNVTSYLKSNCNYTSDEDLQTAESFVVYNGGQYLIKTESWVKED